MPLITVACHPSIMAMPSLDPSLGKSPVLMWRLTCYDTWRSNVEFHFADNFFSDNHTVRKIVESLHLHIVKYREPNSTPHDYLSLLNSAYRTVDDGDELFAKFLLG